MSQHDKMRGNGLELFTLVLCLHWSHCDSQRPTVRPGRPSHMPALDSVTLCYDWNSIPQLSLRCQQQTRIRVLSLGVASKHKVVGSNHYPSGQCNAASDTDCVAYYPLNERVVFQQCNFRQNCDVTLGFEANTECSQLGFTGQNYFHFTYECIPEFYDTWTTVPFLQAYDGNLALTSVSGHSQLHLTSFSYPDYVTASRVVCQLTLGTYSRLRVRTGELRAHGQIAESMQCPYRLYISDSLTHHTQCAKTLWRDDLSPDIVFTNTEAHNVSVQIALESTEVEQSAEAQQTPPSGIQVKFWLMLYTYSTASNLEPNQGLKSITCDSNQPIWRPPTTPLPPTTPSPPTTTTQSTTSLEPVTSSTVRLPISTTDSVNGSSTTESGAEGKAQQQKRRSPTSRNYHVTVIVVLLMLVAIAVIAVVVIVLYRKRRSRQNAGDDPEKTSARSAPSDSYAQLRPTAPNSTETQISSNTTTSSAKSAAKPNVYERIDSIDIGDQYSEIPADIGDQSNTSGAVVDGVEAKDSGSNPAGKTQSEQNTQSQQGGAHTQTENTSSSRNDTGNNTTDTGNLYSKSVKTNTDKNRNFQKGGLHPHNDSEQVFEENDVYESAGSIKPISEGDETAANQIAGHYERPLVVGVGGNVERDSGGDRLGQTVVSKRDSVVIMEENNIYVSD